MTKPPKSHGPWIIPELQNGWTQYAEDPFKWRIEEDGDLAMTGYVQAPENPDEDKPLFQLNSIYRHFFGQQISTVHFDIDGNAVLSNYWIDEDGWLYVRTEPK